jgi:hypothetical protein
MAQSRRSANVNANLKTLSFATVTAALLVGPARADSLTEIAAFAEKICNQSLSGSESSTEIVARLNGDIQGLAKALGISVAGGGLVKRDGSHYEGIPKDKLPASIPTPAQCKADLAKVLIEERQKLARPTSAEDRR